METKKDAVTPPAWRRRLSYFFYALIYLLIGAGVFWLAFRFSDGMESFERGLAIFVTTFLAMPLALDV